MNINSERCSNPEIISICRVRKSLNLSCRDCNVVKERCNQLKVKYGVSTPANIFTMEEKK